ncbi:MAG: acyl carrier protein [Acidobacteriota bacterium]|nr:acyl carrier protein [Acidobacteriota bacterium]MDQ7087982.1 acyl carrier protein [Acidobacteriota bacterium]
MTGDDLRAGLERLVLKNSRLELKSVGDEEELNFDLGFDSHALLNLLLDIEDEYKIEVPPEKIPDLIGKPFGVLVDLVRERLAQG